MSDTCTRCGSTKIIPDVPLLDHYGEVGGFSQESSVAIDGDPQAWFFKDRTYGKVHARVCGACGFTELFTLNCQELYERYLKAKSH